MKKIDCKTFLNYRFVSNPQISPDKRYTAFILKEPNINNNNYSSDVYILRNNSDKIYCLTNHNNISSYSWTKSNEIIFQVDTDEMYKEKLDNFEPLTVYHTINPETLGEKEFFKVPFKAGIPVETDENKYMIIADVLWVGPGGQIWWTQSDTEAPTAPAPRKIPCEWQD